MKTQPNLAELRRLLEAATPGPWTREWNNEDEPDAGIDIQPNGMGYRVALIEQRCDDAHQVADADLICALRNAADFLLRATEERDALNAKLVELCGDFHENDADFIQWKMKRLGLWREAPKAGEGEQR